MNDGCCGSDTPEPGVTDDDEFTAAVEELAEHEKRLLDHLADPAATKAFLADPSAVLRRLKIPVPAAIAHRLRLPDANRIGDLTARPVGLPNGQTITPRAKIRIVGRKR
ncbi:hypothetical protein [Mycolicibacter longobardus]|uniref:Uncharacterized protein n=1 Tax=Mycolicibacter longobardus TaxID=1108812 RepID=A0A1X1YLZ0_9MYCO|nr:hypothetical protein [Mycolicibacter longobardus]MCV7384560.1 hypothetical protein [Mycolicibacter longobardus]ORW12043.1 hypothetical protein AWC16_09385 [Mycolicibacter longobardus]